MVAPLAYQVDNVRYEWKHGVSASPACPAGPAGPAVLVPAGPAVLVPASPAGLVPAGPAVLVPARSAQLQVRRHTERARRVALRRLVAPSPERAH